MIIIKILNLPHRWSSFLSSRLRSVSRFWSSRSSARKTNLLFLTAELLMLHLLMFCLTAELLIPHVPANASKFKFSQQMKLASNCRDRDLSFQSFSWKLTQIKTKPWPHSGQQNILLQVKFIKRKVKPMICYHIYLWPNDGKLVFTGQKY